MTRVRCFILACVLSLVAGCEDDTPTPTPIDPTIFTEVFSGTISQNGAASHPFVSKSSGTVIATLTSIAPDATQVVGVSLGTWTGSVCQIVIANDKATLSSQLQGEFQKKLLPVLEQLSKEKGLHFLFSGADAGLIWAEPGLDLTMEAVKKLDGANAK